MAQRYSIAQARSRLPQIVDEAKAGIEIELTRRGQPVAIVVSPDSLDRLRRRRVGFAEAYRGFLRRHASTEIGREQKVFTKLRDKSPGRKFVL